MSTPKRINRAIVTAVVGSREASTEGRATAWQVASELAAQGAVIGTPLDRVYPKRHAALQL